MNPTAVYALSLAGIGLPAVVGSVAYIACRTVEQDADRAAEVTARTEVAAAGRESARQAAAWHARKELAR